MKMKHILSLALAAIMLFVSVPAFAQGSQNELDELENMLSKYGLEYEIVDEMPDGVRAHRNQSIEEIENMIIQSKSNEKTHIRFNETILLDPSTLSDEDELSLLKGLNNLFTFKSANEWEIINKTKTFSKTKEFLSNANFKLKCSIGTSYQYEKLDWGISNPEFRNLHFTDCDDGSVVHLNPGAYEMNYVSTSGTYGDDYVRLEFEGEVNEGHFVVIGGINVRVPLDDHSFSGMYTFRIDEIVPK